MLITHQIFFQISITYFYFQKITVFSNFIFQILLISFIFFFIGITWRRNCQMTIGWMVFRNRKWEIWIHRRHGRKIWNFKETWYVNFFLDLQFFILQVKLGEREILNSNFFIFDSKRGNFYELHVMRLQFRVN